MNIEADKATVFIFRLNGIDPTLFLKNGRGAARPLKDFQRMWLFVKLANMSHISRSLLTNSLVAVLIDLCFQLQSENFVAPVSLCCL